MLTPLALDTEQFEALFAHARSRIAAVTARRWTNHNEHDPGITLLQLFAYLLEQRSYWVDQVGPDFELAVLRLLGQAPLPRRAARTVVVAGQGAAPALALGAALATADGRLFRVEQRAGILPVPPDGGAFTSSLLGSRDLMPELRARREVVALPADGRPAWLELSFASASPPPAGEPVGVLVELDGPCPPQWSPSAPFEVAAPVQMTVLASTSGGAWKPAARIEDGTCGLRRSGVLRLWPDGWQPMNGAWRIRLDVAAATFPQPVAIKRVLWNATLVGHRAWVKRELALEWPKLPGRTLDLTADCANGAPVSSVHLRLKEKGVWRRWSQVDSLAFSGEGERHFVVEGSRLRFGDGRQGRQPVLDTGGPNARVAFWSGGGPRGNLPAEVELALASAGPWSSPVARTAVEGLGGRDGEALEDARKRCAAAEREVTRGVTAADLEALAAATPGVGVGRAIAAPGLREHVPVKVPGATTVFVLPRVARGGEVPAGQLTPFPMPDDGMLDAVRAHLDRARLLGSELFVEPPIYQPVCIRLKVQTASADRASLEQTLRGAVESYLDPVPLGQGGWPLGAAIDPSGVLAAAQRALGDGATVDAVGVALPGQDMEWCRPVAIGSCHLPKLVGFVVDRIAAAEQGGLR